MFPKNGNWADTNCREHSARMIMWNPNMVKKRGGGGGSAQRRISSRHLTMRTWPSTCQICPVIRTTTYHLLPAYHLPPDSCWDGVSVSEALVAMNIVLKLAQPLTTESAADRKWLASSINSVAGCLVDHIHYKVDHLFMTFTQPR